MFDISWWHLFLFAITAIILIPSKDLPGVLRTLGRYVGDARRMARDFRSQVDDALRETEFAEIKDSLTKDMREIEKTASMSEETRSFNAALDKAAATSGTQPEMRPLAAAEPTGQIIPSAGAGLPVVEADAATYGSGASVPMASITLSQPVEIAAAAAPAELAPPAALNGQSGRDAIRRPNDGIDIVRAGRGSVAQRAAKAWKKTAGGGSSGA